MVDMKNALRHASEWLDGNPELVVGGFAMLSLFALLASAVLFPAGWR